MVGLANTSAWGNLTYSDQDQELFTMPFKTIEGARSVISNARSQLEALPRDTIKVRDGDAAHAQQEVPARIESALQALQEAHDQLTSLASAAGRKPASTGQPFFNAIVAGDVVAQYERINGPKAARPYIREALVNAMEDPRVVKKLRFAPYIRDTDSQHIHLRVPPETLARVKEVAEERNVTMSEVFRSVLDYDLAQRAKAARAAEKENQPVAV